MKGQSPSDGMTTLTNLCCLTLLRMSQTVEMLLQMSYSEWPNDLFFGDFYDTYITGRPYEERYTKVRNMDPTNTTATDLLEAERLIKRNFLTVNMLVQGMMLEYKDDPKLTLPALVSQLGGALNLWAGITVVVIVELVEFFCEVLFGGKKRDKIGEGGEKTWCGQWIA